MPIFKTPSSKKEEINLDPLLELRQFRIKNPIPINENKIVNDMVDVFNGDISILENESDTEISTYNSLKKHFDQYTSEKKLSKFLRDNLDRKINSVMRFSFLSRTAVKSLTIKNKELKDIQKMNKKICKDISDLYELGTNETQSSKLKKALINIEASDQYIKDKLVVDDYNTYIFNSDSFDIEKCELESTSLPYFTADEINQRRDLSITDLDINLSDNVHYKDWLNEMKILSLGLISERYNELYPLWVNKIERLQKENTDISKESVLTLGWNPELPFTLENRILSSKNFLSKLNEYNNILDLSDKEFEDEIIQESNNNELLQPVYVVVTYTKTAFGKLTRTITNCVYTHSTFSFHPNLEKMYSYNMNKNGFSTENIKNFNREDGCIMCVYGIMVNNKQMKTIKNFIDYQLDNIKNSTYSALNLLGVVINKPIHMNNAMICSQFVDSVLKKANIDITKKDSALVTPQDFRDTKSKFLIKLYEGPISEYKPDNIKKKISKIMRSNFKSLSESYIEERELPIRFNDDGDLLIERRNKLDFEEEYAKCHSVIKVYEKADNLDGIKYELCKLWFLNCLIQQKLHSKISESEKKALNKARAKIMNDFTTYNKLVSKNGDFNFSEYYKESSYSDIIKIDNSTIKHTTKIGKGIIKTLLA